MRWILAMLLVANVLLFASVRGCFDASEPPVEIAPERVRVVPLDRLGSQPRP